MRSEALERAEKLERIRYDLTLPCQSQFIRNDAEWLLAEVARLEQERDAEAELFNGAQAALAVAREREQRLASALRNLLARHIILVNSGDCGHWDVLQEPAVVAARAALVDEPAAAENLAALDRLHRSKPDTLGAASAAADEPARVIEGVVYDPSLDSGRTAVVTDDEHVYIEAELPAEGERVRVVITELGRPSGKERGE